MIRFLPLLAALVASTAMAQELPIRDKYEAWIHANARKCCPHNRCFPVEASPDLIRRRWAVKNFDSDVIFGQEFVWPFDKTYGCAYASDPKTIKCLIIPKRRDS